MIPISVYDSLCFRNRSDPTLRLVCHQVPGSYVGTDLLPTGSDNLALRAVELLREAAGINAGADLFLLKRIPMQAGLGGGSSDAAAALLAANRAWDLHWSHEKLASIASELGSDVPFFLRPQLAICRGRGEKIEQLPATVRFHFVVVFPNSGLSTAAVYKQCKVPHQPESSKPLLAALYRGNITQVGKLLHNRLQDVAQELHPVVPQMSNLFDRLDIAGHQMSGSGTSYFGLCRHARHARRVANQLRAQGIGTVMAASSTC